jgi:HD superfamily phosphohydrolase
MFELIIETCHNRWRRGAEDFRRRLLKQSQKPTTIRSAVYGNMEFSSDEMLLIESFYLQRMRRVSQMGLINLVYPDARHSRFEHSLGVLHSLKSLLTSDLQVRRALSTADEVNPLLAAAILHDCGHGPFSHTTETLLHAYGLDGTLRPQEPGEPKSTKPHERRARDMILDKDFHLKHLGIESYGLADALSTRWNVDPAGVVGLIVGKKDTSLANLVSGPFDVDKMDYFRRDAYFSGTTGGGIDMDALKRFVRITGTGTDRRVGFDQRLVSHLLHFLAAREHVYNIGAYHPVTRASAALLLVAGDLAIHALPSELLTLIYLNIELLDDQELLSIFEIAGLQIGKDDATPFSDEFEGALLSRVVRRLYQRRLHKKLAVLSRREFVDRFGPLMQSLWKEFPDGPPPVLYVPISSIAGSRYVPFLDGYRPNDDIAILEMSPPLGPPDSSAAQYDSELAMLQEIILKADDKRFTLAEWLDANAGGPSAEEDGAAISEAKALRSLKFAIWRALVLVPGSIARNLTTNKERAEFLDAFAIALADKNVRRPTSTYVTHSSRLSYVTSEVDKWRSAGS